MTNEIPARLEKEERLEKVNKFYLSNLSNKFYLSNLSNFSTFCIKGVKRETISKFKIYALSAGMKHHEFLDFLLLSYVEANPTIIDRVHKHTYQVEIKVKEPKEPIMIRSKGAEILLAETKELLKNGRLTEKSLAYRCDKLLRPFMLDPNIPPEQKEEIKRFIDTRRG